jgi:hypothetical protein
MAGAPLANQTAKAPVGATPIARGTAFESAIHETVNRFAAAWGDEYCDTAKRTGNISRCRKGDGLLTVVGHPVIGLLPRVVLEMTLQRGTGRDWVSYLDEAERNRGAQASLGVVPSVSEVPGGERIRMFGTTKMIVAYDPNVDDPVILRAVLYILRCQAIDVASRRGSGRARVPAERLAEANDLLEQQLLGVYGTATLAKAHIEKLAEQLDTLRSGTYRKLNQVTHELQEGDDDM